MLSWLQRLFESGERKRYFAQQLENIEALGLAGFACESFVVEKTTYWRNELAKIGALSFIRLHLFRALRLFSGR
jgi:hypothetical protein